MARKLKLEELNRTDISSFKKQEKFPIVLILDNIRSALNVGAAFRTCDAFAVTKLYLVGITPIPPHSDITKSAIGATLSVDFEYQEDIVSCINRVKSQGYETIGLEQTSVSQTLTNFIWPEKVAIVVGNEVNGISDEALTVIDRFVEIPQFGTKHSLNVSVATGMILWDFIKQKISSQLE